jgi:RimJ/RimL family protein N-acetyltransferase
MHLRQARMEDAELLLRWRNDPVTRQNSNNTNEVQSHDHKSWLEKSFLNPDRKIFIAMSDSPVGAVRLDYNGDACELHWMISPEHRNRGFGKQMVELAVQIAKANILHAQIKPANFASMKIALANGFAPIQMLMANGNCLCLWAREGLQVEYLVKLTA